MMSCNNKITVQSLETGQIHRVYEAHGVIKNGDTLVLQANTLNYGYTFYGRYVGKLPETVSNERMTIFYIKAVRIK